MPSDPNMSSRPSGSTRATHNGKGKNPSNKVIDSEQKGVGARIAVITSIVVAAAALVDAASSFITKTRSATCSLIVSLPWCEPTTTPSNAGTTSLENSETSAMIVNAFVVVAYNSAGAPAGGMQSARRDWRRLTPKQWVEMYPGGISTLFDVIKRDKVSGCSGTIAINQDDHAHRVFIPDKGCPGMPLYFSDDNVNWHIVSAMTEIQ